MKSTYHRTMETKSRRCLLCDVEFLSEGNRICGRCHIRHAKLFETYPVGNFEDLIFMDSAGEDPFVSPTGEEG